VIEKRAVGLVEIGEGETVSGKPVHSGGLDMLTLSPGWLDLKNNKVCCSVGNKSVNDGQCI
jgi:hypothetical protein